MILTFHQGCGATLLLVLLLFGVITASHAAESVQEDRARQMFLDADKAQHEGKYDEAITLYSSVLEYKPGATAIFWGRGNSYLAQKKYPQAESDFREMAKKQPDNPAALGSLAWVLILEGQAREALPYAVKARELDAGYFAIAQILGHVYLLTGDEPKAQDSYLQAIALIKDKSEYDAILDDFKLFIQNGWEIDASRRAASWVERIYLHRDELKHADELLSQVKLLRNQGEYAQAIPPAASYSETVGRVFGEESQAYIVSLNNLAFLYDESGDYARAMPLYRKVLESRKRVLGMAHPSYALSLNNLASLYTSMGDYAQALPLFQQALDLRKNVLGEAHPDYAVSLNNLAWVYQLMGDYPEALRLCQQSLEIKKLAYGETHPGYTAGLNNLAEIYRLMGDYDRALALFQKALDLRKNVFGEAHPEYAISLNNLAAVFVALSDYDKALPLFKQALDIRKKTLGEAHPDFATSLNNLALLYESRGDSDKALPLYQRALEIRRIALGTSHPDYLSNLKSLAFVQGEIGHDAESYALFIEGQTVAKRVIANAFRVLTKQQTLKFIQTQNAGYYGMLSLVNRRFSHDDGILKSALDQVFSRKDIMFGTQSRQGEPIATNLDPEAGKLWDKFFSQRAILATMLRNKPKKLSAENYRKQIVECQIRINKLEDALASKSALIAQELEQHKIVSREVSARLGKNGVLAEFVRIEDFDWGHAKFTGKYRYLAFLLLPDDKTQLVDLGDADKLERGALAALKPFTVVSGNSVTSVRTPNNLGQSCDAGNADKIAFWTDCLNNLARRMGQSLSGWEIGRFLMESYETMQNFREAYPDNFFTVT